MASRPHEIRDPIHVFIRLDSDERQVLNAWPLQRLRHIHQLALTYLIYPGATHRRFEHSLGVMELASRIYDVVTDPQNILDDSVRRLVPRWGDFNHLYWSRVLRMAALCHDCGHLPFSHAAEKELLPADWDHERLTCEIILHPDLLPLWRKLNVQPEHVAKLAVGPAHYPEPLDTWETILSEIIVGDAFGADRMDYLLRDSHHAGVAYGRFDHFRLVDTMRILPGSVDDPDEPVLGVERGGLQSAESLLWARYFMYTQLYFHPIRRIYDIHLKDFLKAWLPGGLFPTALKEHLELTDNEVTAALCRAARNPGAPAHDPARRIMQRAHFKRLYETSPADQAVNPESVKCVFEAAVVQFGPDSVRRDAYAQKSMSLHFPVSDRDGKIQSSLAMSKTLQNVPTFAVDYVFVDPAREAEARRWLDDNRDSILQPRTEAG